MNEFQSLANDKPSLFFYLRVYRENGKLRLEALKEAIEKRPFDFIMLFYGSSNHQAQICLYYDGLEADFVLSERMQSKILNYFAGKWFFSIPKT